MLYRLLIVLFLSTVFLNVGNSQEVFNFLQINPIQDKASSKQNLFQLDHKTLKHSLKRNDEALTIQFKIKGQEIAIPVVADQAVVSEIISDYDIISFTGQTQSTRIVGTVGQSLHLMITHLDTTYFLSPTDQANVYQLRNKYELYSESAIQIPFLCRSDDVSEKSFEPKRLAAQIRKDQEDLYNYRLAIATTGEFFTSRGNSNSSVMEQIVTIITRVNDITRRDFGITFTLIGNTDTLFFSDGNDDPFTNGDVEELISENPSVINDLIGSQNYDIGHVFGTNSGGLAWLEGICGGQKAAGASGTFGAYRGELFYLIVAHEIGHQLGATHSFNRCDDENENSLSAFEPGSGSTIMSYAGASDCGLNYIQGVMDPYYHAGSIDQIYGYTHLGNGSKCAQLIATDNEAPQVIITSPNITHIPIETPFELRAQGTDPNEDQLLYNWEEMDLGPKSTLGNPSGDAPLFRSVPPNASAFRSFPDEITVINNVSDVNEVLPAYSRNLKFRVTCRDNHPFSGAVDSDQIAFKSTADAGPFEVLFAQEKTSVEGGNYHLINWSVANTNSQPVNCQFVHILLAIDGINFTDTLAVATENDGSEYVLFPDIIDGSARLKIVAADHIFYNLSQSTFSITESTASFSAAVSDNSLALCTPGFIDLELYTFDHQDTSELIELIINTSAESLGIIYPERLYRLGDTIPITFESGHIPTMSIDPVEFLIIARNDTVSRMVNISRTPSNFEAFKVIYPKSGEGNVPGLPIMTWTNLADAESYFVQLSASPSFDSLIESEIVQDTFLKPTFSLPQNSIFYWRVQPLNACATGSFTPIAAFQTQNINCTTYQSEDTPKTGSRRIESTINVPDDFPLVDVNIPNMAGLFQFVGNIDAKLVHGDGTTITLFKDRCSNRSNFDLGFDDDAILEISCPLTDKNIHKPEEALADMNITSSNNSWTLQINDNGGTSGGSITEWTLELCTDLTVSPPILENIDSIRAPFQGEIALGSEYLTISDPNSAPEQIIIVLVELPAYGILRKLDGNSLGVGDTFNYQAILDEEISYVHTGEDMTPDGFEFLVQDESGGWIPISHLPIQIEQPTSSHKLNVEYAVFPNPARHSISILVDPPLYSVQVMLFNQHGQLLKHYRRSYLDNSAFPLPELPNGVYFLQIRSEQKFLTEKLWISN